LKISTTQQSEFRREPGSGLKTERFPDAGTVKKSCHSGKNQKTCPHENGDEYFLIFTRNPLFAALSRKNSIC
jgi:hypothetical protein